MNSAKQLVIFVVQDQHYALPLSSVERIVRAVEITELPTPSKDTLGVINIEGRIVPVLNSRKIFGKPEREMELRDLFVIVTESNKSVALVADQVKPVMVVPDEKIVPSEEFNSNGYVKGITGDKNGMIIVLATEQVLAVQKSPVPLIAASVTASLTQEMHHG